MPTLRSVHFPAKFAVHKDNITDGEHHANAPPDQADSKCMLTGDGATERDVVRSAGGGRKQRGIDSPARSSQHEEQVKARGEKRFDRLSLAVEEPESEQGHSDADRHNERSWIVEVIVQTGRAYGDCGQEADRGEHDQNKPEWCDDAASALLEFS